MKMLSALLVSTILAGALLAGCSGDDSGLLPAPDDAGRDATVAHDAAADANGHDAAATTDAGTDAASVDAAAGDAGSDATSGSDAGGSDGAGDAAVTDAASDAATDATSGGDATGGGDAAADASDAGSTDDASDASDAGSTDAAADASDAGSTDAASDAGADAADGAGAFVVVQACAEGDYEDHTAPGDARLITPWDTSLGKKCFTIKVGQSVTWDGVPTVSHPLGATNDGTTPNPITNVATTQFDTAGVYGWHCTIHLGLMSGAIRVVP